METLLIAWCVWVGVILFLCPLIKRGPESSRMRSQQTAQAGLDYIRISIALLSEWEMHQSNLLIIDLRSDTTKGANGNSIPGSLNIPIAQLARLLCWIHQEAELSFATKARSIASAPQSSRPSSPLE